MIISYSWGRPRSIAVDLGILKDLNDRAPSLQVRAFHSEQGCQVMELSSLRNSQLCVD